ncbi:MAG: TIM44-like domain-containing protein [Deltaproteobacteria bacterium]|nr:TIM44-like domain-containing protein [Deltaproteobacteria bacterium]
MKKVLIIVAAVIFCLSFTFEEAGARAGFRSGRSSYGYRGSRTYAAPAKPSAPKTEQAQKTAEPEPAYQPQSQPRPQGAFGGFGRTLAGGLIGGMIGSFLFSSLGYGATSSGFGGVGLFDILLIGLGVFLFIRFLRPGKAGNGEAGKAGPEQKPYQQTDAFLRDLKRADATFDAEEFRKKASDVFVKVQAAWKKRDLEPVKKYIAGDLFYGMAAELEKAVAGGSVNHIEKVSVRDSGIAENWQEEGLDYVTVRFTVEASALSTDRDGNAVGDGPKPVAFSEYWTFVREVLLQDWKLTAIQQERA